MTKHSIENNTFSLWVSIDCGGKNPKNGYQISMQTYWSIEKIKNKQQKSNSTNQNNWLKSTYSAQEWINNVRTKKEKKNIINKKVQRKKKKEKKTIRICGLLEPRPKKFLHQNLWTFWKKTKNRQRTKKKKEKQKFNKNLWTFLFARQKIISIRICGLCGQQQKMKKTNKEKQIKMQVNKKTQRKNKNKKEIIICGLFPEFKIRSKKYFY